MPNCQDCSYFQPVTSQGPQCALAPVPDFENMSLRQHRSRVKACEFAILKKHTESMRGKQVLEIGFGVNRWIKKTLNGVINWHGIDARFDDHPEENRVRAKASQIPHEDNKFDWVLCFSSVEHWNEFGDKIEDGLAECFRVLKPEGNLLFTAPYHNHGADIFYYGNRTAVEKLFRTSAAWSVMVFEEWARVPDPLPRLTEWKIEKRKASKLLKQTNGIEPTTSTVEIFATK